MTDSYSILLTSAAGLGILHTAIGIDHSLPLVVLGKSRGWSLAQTLSLTAVCGLGHVMSSVLIAGVGLALGIAGNQLEWIEATRGSFAAWLLVGFGLAYAAAAHWKNRSSALARSHANSSTHHFAPQDQPLIGVGRIAPALFVIFVLGPCEAMLPLLTASGVALSPAKAISVAFVFCGTTILTMLTLVTAGYLGTELLGIQDRWSRLAPHTHTLAGLALVCSGLSIQVLGI